MPNTPRPELPAVPRVSRLVDLGRPPAGPVPAAEPVYLGKCQSLTCEEPAANEVQFARLIDFAALGPPPHPGMPPSALPTGRVPVYGVPPPECCEGDKRRVAVPPCGPPAGMPREVILFLRPGPGDWSQCEFHCGPILLRYSDADQKWHSVAPARFRTGTMDFLLECDPSGRWKLTGSGCGSFVALSTSDCANDAIHMDFAQTGVDIGGTCCWAFTAPHELLATVIGSCSYAKQARLVDFAGGVEVGTGKEVTVLPVYEVTRCCPPAQESHAPDCCGRRPLSLVVELVSDHPLFNGLVVTVLAQDGYVGLAAAGGNTVRVAVECVPYQPNADVSPCPPAPPGTAVVCREQGYAECDVRTYVAGAFRVAAQCVAGAVTLVACDAGGACDQCNCDGRGQPIDFTVSGRLVCDEVACGCAFVGQTFAFTAHVTE